MTHDGNDQPLAGLWAKKYVNNLLGYAWGSESTTGTEGRDQYAEKLLSTLRFASSQAWARTEGLLANEIGRHRLDPALIDPWRIAEDSRRLFSEATYHYRAQISPEKFSVAIAPECGRLRGEYTRQDPRVLGFMSMQFHYTGQLLLEHIPGEEKEVIHSYLKVMDDHLYMPLQRSYEAAAQQNYHAPTLKAVRQLLPLSTQIAETMAAAVAKQHSQHRCYSGYLNNPNVRISSIRDGEMFQIYLCLCVMEGNIASVQQELFPLCVMLYPPLRVRWELVRQLIQHLDQAFHQSLTPEAQAIFQPYLQALENMFSLEVFPENDPIWSHHPDTIRYMDEAKRLLQEFQGQEA